MNSRVVILLALIWFPLTAYVMFRSALGALANYLLLPAIPSVIVLYAPRAAQLARVLGGNRRRQFGLLLAADGVAAPICRWSIQQTLVPSWRGRRQTRDTVSIGLGTCAADVLSRTVWGCQRVLVWGSQPPRWLTRSARAAA